MFDIIIVTYNAKDKLRKCLSSIKRHTQGVKYLLTIVDNHSNDGSYEYLKKLNSPIQLIRNGTNKGFSYGANLALKKTGHEFIALLDDDVEVPEGWLGVLHSQFKKNPKAGIVGAKIVYPNNRLFSVSYHPKLMETAYGEIDIGQVDYIKECDALSGACWLMKRSILKDVGYFDEGFFPCQYEDTDYCVRTRLKGYKIIYNGRVRIIHSNLLRDLDKSSQNRARFFKKWKQVLRKFPLKDSHPVDKLIEEGQEYLRLKKYPKALLRFTQARSVHKNIYIDPISMARVFYETGKYKKALNECKKTLLLYSDDRRDMHIPAHALLGLLYHKMGLYKEALEEHKICKSLKFFGRAQVAVG